VVQAAIFRVEPPARIPPAGPPQGGVRVVSGRGRAGLRALTIICRVKIAVVISAYNNWEALRCTLRGYARQTRPPEEIWVAEDSEFPEVRQVVDQARAELGCAVGHLTQSDNGFRKCRILNRTIAASAADYLVFTDADCVPRADVVATFAARARPGEFLSAGSHLNLPQRLHGAGLRPEWIDDQRLFSPRWLRAQGLRLSPLRLLPPAGLGRSAAHVLDRLTPRDAFVGNLSGAWRADLLRVAGFDEAMAYGAEDRNLGIRLNHAGVRGRRLRHALVCLHLEHARTWRHDAQVLENRRWNASLPAQTTLPRQSGLLDGGVTPASVAPPSPQAGCSESAGCDGPPVHPAD
jgi:GT2 family glycosyltransferase